MAKPKMDAIANLVAKGQDKEFKMVANSGGSATLYIYDEISPHWGISAMQVIEAINKVIESGAKELHVRFKCPGGSIFEGRAIAEAIRRFPGTTIAHIDSIAASAATFISLSCGRVLMAEGAFFMIHRAQGGSYGDAAQMRKDADLLEKIEVSIIADYVNKTGMSKEEIAQMLADETWLSAQEALDQKFIDEIEGADTDTAGADSATNQGRLLMFGPKARALFNQLK